MATFGQTTDNTSVQAYTTDRKLVSIASPTSTGVVTAGTTRLFAASGSHPSRMIIYSDSAGAPNTLLAISDETIFSNTTEAAVNYTFSGANQITVTAGVNYWIGVHWTAGGVSTTVSRANTASLTQGNNDTYSDGAASTFGAVAVTSGPIDSFITYTPSAGTTGSIKVHNGTAFVAKPVKVWNGASWVTKPLKQYNGSAWVATNY